MKRYSLLIVVLTVSSCQSLHSSDPTSIMFDIPDGSSITLNKELTIPASFTHALIQAGRLITEKDRKNYAINCRLDAKAFGPRTILPEKFSILRTEDGSEWVLEPEIMQFYTEIYLQSDSGTDVIKLDCQEWGDATDNHFTVADMEAALGDYFSISYKK